MRDTIKKIIEEVIGVIEESARHGGTVTEAIEAVTSILGTPRRAALDDYANTAERLVDKLGAENSTELVKRYMELEAEESMAVLEKLPALVEAGSGVAAAIMETQSGLPRMSDLENVKFARPSAFDDEPPRGRYAAFSTAREGMVDNCVYYPEAADVELAEKELSKMVLPSRAEAERILWVWVNEMLLVHEGNTPPDDVFIARIIGDPAEPTSALTDEREVCDDFFAGKIDPPDVPLVVFGDDKRHRQHGIQFEQHGFWFLTASQAVEAGLISAFRPDIVMAVPPRAD